MNTQPCSESQVVTIDVHKAVDLLRNANYRYLDVRTEEEFNKGHVGFDDALNIPYMFNTPQGRVKNLNFLDQVLLVSTKDDHLVVGCQSGVRSVYASTDLLDAGFKHVYNMGGGYLAWVENGLPVIVPTVKLYSGSKVVTIDVHKAVDLLRNEDYRYLDVRTEEEFKKGHVDFDDTLNIPYMFNTPEGRVKNPNFMEQVLPVCTKDDHLVVGCQSGVRSVYATTDLLDAGFKHVYNMGGGYLAWVENELPAVPSKVDTMENGLSAVTPKVNAVENGQHAMTSRVEL